MTENPIRIVRAAPVRVTRPGADLPVRVVSRGEIADETRVRAVPVGLPGEDGTNGADGREIELRQTITHIEWRRTGETNWQQLIAIADLASAGLNGGDF